MGYYEMDPDVVQTSGRQEAGLEPEAQAVVTGLLNGYADGSGAVVHARVSSALSRFHDTHQETHRSVPRAVAALGFNTASGGVVVADASNESTGVQLASLGDQQQSVAALRRPILA